MVVARGEGELTMHVGDAVRPLVLQSLQDHRLVAEESLAHAAHRGERKDLEARLATIESLRDQLESTVGGVGLTASEELIAEIAKATTSNATYALETLVGHVSATSAPVTAEVRESLRNHAFVATICVETLIACEVGRGRA